jgi:long-chain acyl-CoA synthetase
MSSELPAKQTLPSLIRTALAEGRDEALVERVAGAWTPTSTARLLERVENVACAIRDAGVEAGDRVALVSHNSIDWVVCDFATLFAGCIVVPIYPTQALDHTAYILEHSGARLIFVDGAETLARLRETNVALPRVVVLNSSGEGLQPFEARGAALRLSNPELPAAYESALRPDDLAVLIYTSGTTGPPKGVMLSHDNLAFNAQVSLDCGFEGIEGGRDVLSVLPYSHIYEHTLIYIYLLAKVRYFICHDPGELLKDLKDVRPVEMTSVPRIFDRVLGGVKGQALAAGGLKGRLVPWALEVGREYMRTATLSESAPSAWATLQYGVAKAVVLRKIPLALGLDRVKFLTSGSAPLHIDTAMTFLAMGIPIMQGYGLTETSPVISVSRLSANEYGAVGRPITGVDVAIAPDGEVLVRGRNVMLGYYRDAEATAAALHDGWLHTGDVGEIDGAGFLRITDRKNEIFKTDTGKWVSPARVEANIKRSIFIAQALVVGNGRPYPLALICPNWKLVRLELPELPAEAAPEELAVRNDVRAFLTHDVREQTRALASYEQVRRIIVVPTEFSVEGGELSPSMKIKRRVVEKNYAAQIEQAYGGSVGETGRSPEPYRG